MLFGSSKIVVNCLVTWKKCCIKPPLSSPVQTNLSFTINWSYSKTLTLTQLCMTKILSKKVYNCIQCVFLFVCFNTSINKKKKKNQFNTSLVFRFKRGNKHLFICLFRLLFAISHRKPVTSVSTYLQ